MLTSSNDEPLADPRDGDARRVPTASRVMTEDPTHSNAQSAAPISNADVQALTAEAEAGYDVEQLLKRRSKRGRPALGSAPASVESVRLDPELRSELLQRAQSEGKTPSEIIREALRRFLRAA